MNRKPCGSYVDHIHAVVRGRSSSAQRLDLGHHLDHCRPCSKAMEESRLVHQHLAPLREAPLANTPDWDAIEQRLDVELESPKARLLPSGLGRRLRSGLLGLLQLARPSGSLMVPTLALLLVLVLGIAGWRILDRPVSSLAEAYAGLQHRAWIDRLSGPVTVDRQLATAHGALVIGQRISTGRDGSVTLLDMSGAEIQLGPNSSGRYTRLSTGLARFRLDRGIVFLSVASQQPGHSVQVVSDEMLLKVVGTVFSVEKDASATRIQVLSGVVKVRPNKRDALFVRKMQRMQVGVDGKVELDQLRMPGDEPQPKTPQPSLLPEEPAPKKRRRVRRQPDQRTNLDRQAILLRIATLNGRLQKLQKRHRGNDSLLKELSAVLKSMRGKSRSRFENSLSRIHERQKDLLKEIAGIEGKLVNLRRQLGRLDAQR